MAYTTVPTVIDGDDFTDDFTLGVKDAVDELQAAVPETSTVWTPTVGGLTKGDGAEYARYCRIGSRVFCEWKFTLGSTSAVTGDMSLSLPVNSLAQRTALGNGYIQDASPAARYLVIVYSLNNSSVLIRQMRPGASYTQETLISSTVPMTWAVNDIISVSFDYFAA